MKTNAKQGRKEIEKKLNIIGETFNNATPIAQGLFLGVAENKAKELGIQSSFPMVRKFKEIDSMLPLSNVAPYFLHSACVVFGLSFPLQMTAPKETAVNIDYQIREMLGH